MAEQRLHGRAVSKSPLVLKPDVLKSLLRSHDERRAPALESKLCSTYVL